MAPQKQITTASATGNGSGAAFLLRDRPPHKVVIPLGCEGTAELDPESPYVVVRFVEPLKAEELEDSAHRLAQQSLDLYAARGLGNLATRRSEFEFVLWWREGTNRHIRFVDTVISAWRVDAVGVVGDGDPAPPPPLQFPAYHPAFRFFRLSQVTDDLFDSFRNAYLALELLVSDEVPKLEREGEPTWLKRALSGVLADCVPAGIQVEDLVDSIYRNARLPLFHAKAQRNYVLPQDCPRDRRGIQASLTTTLQVAVNLFRRLGPQIVQTGGSMSRAARHVGCVARFTADAIRISHGDAEMVVPSPFTSISYDRLRFDNPTFLVSASLAGQPGIDAVQSLSLQRDGVDSLSTDLAQAFSLEAIDQLEVLVQVHERNSREPKTVFSQ